MPNIIDTGFGIIKKTPDQHVYKGTSQCHTCGKTMVICWDTVCSKCHKTFCYNHSYEVDGKWVCENCHPNQASISLYNPRIRRILEKIFNRKK